MNIKCVCPHQKRYSNIILDISSRQSARKYAYYVCSQFTRHEHSDIPNNIGHVTEVASSHIFIK